MEPTEAAIVAKAKELSKALQDWGYTRKDEDKKHIQELQMDLIHLCENA